jgi:RNA polymerase sigma-70 factor, ECF subfamily
MISDNDLVQLLREGDAQVFEQIFNRYFEGLCLFAESITKNHEVAEDIVEDLFLQLWISCKINPIKTSVKSYLFQSTYNNSIRYISRIRKNIVSIDHPDYNSDSSQIVELSTSNYPVTNLIVRELEQKASAIINSLPEQCRKVYLLNRDEDLKYSEIAKRLNISVGTVKTQMSRAFSKLREELKDFLYIFF